MRDWCRQINALQPIPVSILTISLVCFSIRLYPAAVIFAPALLPLFFSCAFSFYSVSYFSLVFLLLFSFLLFLITFLLLFHNFFSFSFCSLCFCFSFSFYFFFSFSFYSLCLLFCLHFESRLIFMFIDSTVVRYKTMVGPLPEIWIYSHHPETCFIILLVIAVLLFWLVSEQKIAAGGVKRPHSSSVPIIHSFVAEGSPKKKKRTRKTSLLFLAMLSVHHIAKGYVYFIQHWYPSHHRFTLLFLLRLQTVAGGCWGEGGRISSHFVVHL